MYRYLGKYGCIEQVLLCLDKCGCVWASMVVFGQVWLYLGEYGCTDLGKYGYIWAK